jgi:hypothetical protein
MLADEEPSLPAPGDLLAGIGIRAYGTPAAAPRGAADGIEEVLVTGVRPQDAQYVLTGTVSSIRDYDAGEGTEGGHAGAECVLDTGMGRFHVQYAGWARDVDPGSRAQLRSTLTAIGGYEWEAFGLTTMARRPPARVGQACRSMSSPLREAKKLSARALSQHWPVRPRDSTTW